MKRYLPFLIIVLVGSAAFTGGALIYRAKKAELTQAATAIDASGKTVSVKPGAIPPHVRGQAKAAVTLEEFGDFQCPPCETLSPLLSKLEHDYSSKLRLVFRQFPLAMHNHAALAARAAEAAGRQGRFWEMHDLLYRNRSTWSKAPDTLALFNQYAGSLGLNPERFRGDLESTEVKARVAADQERGTSFGIKSTPSILINNRLLPPSSMNEAGLRAAIDAALSGKPPPSPPSPSPQP